MWCDDKIVTQRLVLRVLTPDDVTECYIRWLNDPIVGRYLESRAQHQDMDAVREFVRSMNDSNADLLFGIFTKEGDNHIGNIRLGVIEKAEGRAAVGLLIGEPASWNKGYASEAIRGMSDYAFQTQGLERLYAGCHADNVGSRRAFLKAGWQEEGRQYGHFKRESGRTDMILVGLLKK